jgi:hypothetical protein
MDGQKDCLEPKNFVLSFLLCIKFDKLWIGLRFCRFLEVFALVLQKTHLVTLPRAYTRGSHDYFSLCRWNPATTTSRPAPASPTPPPTRACHPTILPPGIDFAKLRFGPKTYRKKILPPISEKVPKSFLPHISEKFPPTNKRYKFI